MRVGIYARVSTDAQEARGTIGSQLGTLRTRVSAEGDELVAEFIDDGCSGARLDRPGLDDLRDAAEAGRVDAVWCLSPDRLARSYAYQILILDELARYQVPVHFTDTPPLDDPQGRLLVQIQGVIAEHERAKFVERGRRGKLYRARAGEVLSTKVPYGYRRVPRGADGPAHVVVYEPEAAVVRRVFADFLAGQSLRHLAVTLSADGIASPEGKPVWRLSTICRLLRNEAYVGRLYWNRTQTSYDRALGKNRQTLRPREEWIEIPVPVIIDEDIFEAVEAKARDNSVYSPRHTEAETFLLRRLLRCPACGVKLVCHRARHGQTTTRYYLCPHRDPWRAGGADRRCPERRVRADELDTFVFDQVRQLLARPELLAAGETALAGQTPAPDDQLLTAQLARLDRRLQSAHTERRRVADLYQAGVIDNTEMSRRAREIDNRCRRFDEERQSLITRQSELATENRLHQGIVNFAEQAVFGIDTLGFEGRQQLMRLVLEDVRVRGWQVELRLRIPLDDVPPAGIATSTSTTLKRTRTRSPRGSRPTKEAVSSNDRLRSIGEGTQEGAHCGGRHDRVIEHFGGRSRPEHVGVVDVRGAGHHRMDERQHLATRLEAPGAPGHVHPGIDQVLQVELLHDGGDEEKSGIGHQIGVIEHHRYPVDSARYWFHRKCLLGVR
ncbi:MAG: recombinase family protein [Actinomycetota bacterium]|nr:recombinase family protein [Actinomycetota bacterium]